MERKQRKLADQVCDVTRTKHRSLSRERACVSWIRKYIIFHNKRHLRDMGEKEIESFLTHWAVRRTDIQK